MTEVVLEARDISKKYKDKTVIDSVSFKVNRGEIYGIIGQAGAGKTVLLSVLSGIEEPTGGSLLLFDADDPKRIRSGRQRTGSFVGNSGIYPELTVFENMKVKSLCFKKKISKQTIREILYDAGLAGVEDIKGYELSVSERRLLGVAMALVSDPELLFLDDPFLKCDDDSVNRIVELVRSCNREKGTAVVLTSTDRESLSGLASRLGILSDGKLREETSEN